MNFKKHPLFGKLKLFVFDLDHTALGGHSPYARLPDEFSAFLDNLHQEGCQWGINTTWDVNGQWELVRQSSVQSRPLFYMGEYGKTLARDGSTSPIIIEDFTNKNDEKVEEIRKREMDPLFSTICGGCLVSKAFHYGHLFSVIVREDYEAALDTIIDETNTIDLSISRKKGCVNVKPAFLNKGMALREAQRLSGISPQQTMSTGDSIPDIHMMTKDLATYAIAPGNACDEVKKHIVEKNGQIGTSDFVKGVIEAFHMF